MRRQLDYNRLGHPTRENNPKLHVVKSQESDPMELNSWPRVAFRHRHAPTQVPKPTVDTSMDGNDQEAALPSSFWTKMYTLWPCFGQLVWSRQTAVESSSGFKNTANTISARQLVSILILSIILITQRVPNFQIRCDELNYSNNINEPKATSYEHQMEPDQMRPRQDSQPDARDNQNNLLGQQQVEQHQSEAPDINQGDLQLGDFNSELGFPYLTQSSPNAQDKTRSGRHMNEPAEGDAEDLLEAGQSVIPSTNTIGGGGSGGQADNGDKATGMVSSVGVSSDQLTKALNALLQQAANQVGQGAATLVQQQQQQNALSESLISGLASSLGTQTTPTRNIRKPEAQLQQQQQQQPLAGQQVPRPQTVGQSINGNIEYDSNQNVINGFIDFPSFIGGNGSAMFSSLGGAVKPLLLAGLKTVPLKLGGVGWKLLKLLALKKIYKAHHPKSAEVVFEQEMSSKDHHSAKHQQHSDEGSSDNAIGSMDVKLVKSLAGTGKLSGGDMVDQQQHHPGGAKTSKMGFSLPSQAGLEGATSPADWAASMMMLGGARGSGGAGWPGPEGHLMSGSMLHHRALLAPHSGSHPPSAAAAAAAAAATAAAIQSHWIQQQQQLMFDNQAMSAAGNQSTSSNSVGPSGAGAGPQLALLQQRKRSLANQMAAANWFAGPAHAHAYAAAAANAAAALAAQQHQQRQRMAAAIEFATADATPPWPSYSADHYPAASGHHHRHPVSVAASSSFHSMFDDSANDQNAIKFSAPPASLTDHQDMAGGPGTQPHLFDQSADVGQFGDWPMMQSRDWSSK